MSLKISLQSSSLVRETIATGLLPELEFGLLKKYGKMLGWHTADKAVLLDMTIDEVKAKGGPSDFDIRIRTLCHSRGVTADYLKANERFHMKPCVLVLGDVGVSPAPWAQLVQAAVHLFQHEFNLIWVEVPSFITNSQRWMTYGPEFIKASLKFLGVSSVSVLAQGVGGSVFLQTLSQYPRLFSRTHFIYNLDLPEGSKVIPFPLATVEELLRQNELQIWCAYQDDPDDGRPGRHTGFDRSVDGTPMKAYDAMSKMQSRLEGERRRGRRVLHYDEVLITEALNNPKEERVLKPVAIGTNYLTAFSGELLESLARFMQVAPGAFMADVLETRGLVGDFEAKLRDPALAGEAPLPELPALRRLRVGYTPQERKKEADKNRRRLKQLDHGLLCLMRVPSAPALLNDSVETNATTGNPLSLEGGRATSAQAQTTLSSISDVAGALISSSKLSNSDRFMTSTKSDPFTRSDSFSAEAGSSMSRSMSMGFTKSMPSQEYTSMWAKIRADVVQPVSQLP